MWGGRLTKFTNNYSAAEFSYTRNGSDLKARTAVVGSAVPNFDAGKVTMDEYDLNFLVSSPAPDPKMWPYFVLGFGWTVTHPDIKGPPGGALPAQAVSVSSKSLFAFNFGIGTMIQMNPKMAARLDARWRVTDTNISTSSGVYCDYWGYCWGYSSSWYNSGEFTAGLEYRLGK
jgi:hypothetical protein